MAVRVKLRRTKGWRMPPNTVSVARPGRWGNPFTVGCKPSEFSADMPDYCETVVDAVELFRAYAETWISVTDGRWVGKLRGKNLACWCPLTDPCHADVLLELANEEAER